MQAYICDVCNKHEEPQKLHNIPPEGWYTVSRKFTTFHACSPKCLVEYATKEEIIQNESKSNPVGINVTPSA